MALDESILFHCGQKQSLPTLRLYSWNPPCLSLGHNQPTADVDLAALVDLGWDLVRRPTGGRAILHTDELTYAVITHQEERVMTGSVLESYFRLSSALLQALSLLELDAHAEPKYALPEGTNKNAPVCFEVPSSYEITANGKKIIGSAQARKLGGVLQHGSLPLYGDLSRITKVLQLGGAEQRKQAADRLLSHATTAESILGEKLAWDKAANAFSSAFASCLQISWVEEQPSQSELEYAQELMRKKYNQVVWTQRI